MDGGRSPAVLFNVGKGESHHPKSGFKRLARRLRAHHSVGVLDETINADSLGDVSPPCPAVHPQGGVVVWHLT